jgi:DNA-binding transcriptional LysR family regulator
MSIELRHLRAFVAVAEELNFTRAAHRLHLAQQALSKQIRQLEERVGEQLVTRTTRRVELTAAGVALLEHARAVLGGADRAVAAARAAGEGSQTLVLGFVVPADHESMRPALALFRERRPDVELQVRFGDVTDPTGGLRDGQADVALVVGAFDQSGLQTLHLWTDARGVAVGSSHPFAHKADVTIPELLAEPTFDFPVPDPVFRDYWMANNHRGGRPPKIVAQFRSLDGLLEAVRAGLGVNLIRQRIVDTLGPTSGIVFRPVRGLEPADASLAWAEGDTSDLVADFVDGARDAFDINLGPGNSRLRG